MIIFCQYHITVLTKNPKIIQNYDYYLGTKQKESFDFGWVVLDKIPANRVFPFWSLPYIFKIVYEMMADFLLCLLII